VQTSWLALFIAGLVTSSSFSLTHGAQPPAPLPVDAAADLDLLPGFHAQRLYLTPSEQGSWVSMAFDPQGRITVSKERGGLYRITPSPRGNPTIPTRVEKLDVQLDAAQGLLYAFDSLYAVSHGIQRLQDTNGDDQFDSVRQLMEIEGSNEHGQHAILLGPEQKWLYLIAGNQTYLPDSLTMKRALSTAPSKHHSPPRPQGWVMRVKPEGQHSELLCIGLRNAYDMALNEAGEFFTFDSDNEGYMNLPWYRPTNVYHVVSGADFGWRQGPDTLQAYHPDNPPPVLEVGPGSPTGMVFGTNSEFPARYQQAMFVGDWSYGRIYAIHLQPAGASFRARQELFISGRPLAVTDLCIGPDGAMYFITGGRGTQSALYRVSWNGGKMPDVHKESETTPTGRNVNAAAAFQARTKRRQLEEFHGRKDTQAVETAWPHLLSGDRALRYAARVAIEHQDVDQWETRALSETRPQALLEAMIALARQGDPQLRSQIVKKLSHLDWDKLETSQRLALLRAYEITFQRMGTPRDHRAAAILAQLDSHYPHQNSDMNRELVKLLISLNSSNLVERTITVLKQTPSAMRQIHFLHQLDRLEIEWQEDVKQRLINTLDLEVIRDTGQRKYTDVSKLIDSLLQTIGVSESTEPTLPARQLVREWSLEDLLPLVTPEQLQAADVQRGQTVFRQAQCHSCHRIGSTGGVLGPNLTGLAGRFQPRDVLESMIDPDKVVSDQYRTTVFFLTNGKQVTGQIVNLEPGEIQIRLDPLRPFPRVSFPENEIEDMQLSKVSLMPKGLLNYLEKEEILDLMSYLLQTR
jgi:putative heme-binding domain-containing protein